MKKNSQRSGEGSTCRGSGKVDSSNFYIRQSWSLPEWMAFELRPVDDKGASKQAAYLGKEHSRKRNNNHKEHKAGACLACQRSNKEASLAREERVKVREAGYEE